MIGNRIFTHHLPHPDTLHVHSNKSYGASFHGSIPAFAARRRSSYQREFPLMHVARLIRANVAFLSTHDTLSYLVS